MPARRRRYKEEHMESNTALRQEGALVYRHGDRLYVNLTNRCTARCLFCVRESRPVVEGKSLRLRREHTAAEYLKAMGDPRQYSEVVFCGYGEPTLRLQELLQLARAVKAAGCRVRLNTNGHGNLIHKRNIVPELKTCLDEISISINAPDPLTYLRIVRPDSGKTAFGAVIDFVWECVGCIPRVTLTAIDFPGQDLEACRRLAEDMGAEFRMREYQRPGTSDFGLRIPD